MNTTFRKVVQDNRRGRCHWYLESDDVIFVSDMHEKGRITHWFLRQEYSTEEELSIINCLGFWPAVNMTECCECYENWKKAYENTCKDAVTCMTIDRRLIEKCEID